MSQTVLTKSVRSSILIVNQNDGTVTIGLDYAKQRHDQAMAEVQFWRKLMGWEPLLTGAQQRKMSREASR